MNKPTIILLLISTLFSCQKNIERIDIANELRGNTFNMTSIGEKDTLTIEFKDSTYTVFEYSDQNLPWRIATFDNNDFLVFDRRVIAIKQKDKNSFKGLLIAEEDYEIILEKRKTIWNKELLNGIWIEEKYIGTKISEFEFPLPPSYLPPLPESNYNENDYEWPPYYKITGDKISSNYFYMKSKSPIQLNNSIEFISMKLNSNFFDEERLWKILMLTDSLMIVEKTITKKEGVNIYSTSETRKVKLIKKR